MKNILFYGGASLLSNMWLNYWNLKYNIFLGLNKRWIEFNFAKSIKISNDKSETKDILSNNNIDTIINCAGITNVEECEQNPDQAKKINGFLPADLAEVCLDLNIKLIHISTDHLYDGLNKMVDENDPLCPLNVYGESKAFGDNQVLKNNDRALIIRTNFFGDGPTYKKSFSDKIIHSLKNDRKIYLFDNVYYTPIHIFELADSVESLINLDIKGVINISCDERITKYDFGMMIAKKLQFNDKLIEPIKIEDKKDLTIRPKDMSLSNRKLKTLLRKPQISIIDQINFLNHII
tara:strand:- start:959 stop:1834 length:876 start_codon:yes stop_codon:yes gene_type:complete